MRGFRPGENDVPKIRPGMPGLKALWDCLPLLESFMHDKQAEQVICDFSGLKLSYGNISQFAVWLTYTENIKFATLDISANYIACQTWQGFVHLMDILAPYADVIDFRDNYLPAHDNNDLHLIPGHVLVGPKTKTGEFY